MFFSSAPRFLAKRFQLHAPSSRKKGEIVRAPKKVLHKLQFFMELLHGGVCEAEFVEQSQTPPIRERYVSASIYKDYHRERGMLTMCLSGLLSSLMIGVQAECALG